MRFNVIYADPPWAYNVYSKKGDWRSAENHYHTMTAEDIYNLDVEGIADKDCVLFLWVTFPCLLQGLETLKLWGFEYKTLGFCWVKRNRKQTDKWFWGLDFWTRGNPELCLIATKGKPKRVSAVVHCVVDSPVEQLVLSGMDTALSPVTASLSALIPMPCRKPATVLKGHSISIFSPTAGSR